MALKIQDFIDVEQFQLLQDRLNEIYSFPSAIIDNDGKVLTTTAWQDICTKFHRQNSECEKECIKSDQYIASHLHEANPAVNYRCPHGLIDNATPIIIEGVHYGNFFTGQFFLEPPDLNFFRAQAKRYGFDEEAYIEAVKKVPVWTQAQLNSYLFFIKGLIEVIAGIGQKSINEINTRKRMQESEERFRTILQTAMDGFWLVDMQGRLMEVNEAYCRMSGYSTQELLAMRIPDLEAIETEDNTATHIQKVMAKSEDRFESRHRRKDGSIFDLEVSVQYQPTDGGQIVTFLRDITERKRAEETIRESEHKYRMLFENANDGIFLQEKTVFVACNEKGASMYGLPRKEVVGRSPAELSPKGVSHPKWLLGKRSRH
jgi:two-component system cell cycle sensor histidine kinase/response regulator CckA